MGTHVHFQGIRSWRFRVSRRVHPFLNRLPLPISVHRFSFLFNPNFLCYISAVCFLTLINHRITSCSCKVEWQNPIAQITSKQFSLMWILSLSLLPFCFKQKIGRTCFSVIAFITSILYVTQRVYFAATDYFFTFNMMTLFSEGSSFMLTFLLHADRQIYFDLLLLSLLFRFTFLFFPHFKTNRYWLLCGLLIVSSAFHFHVRSKLGEVTNPAAWDLFDNTRSIYNTFTDSNKNMKLCGFYEFSVRDFYVTFIRSEQRPTKDDISALHSFYRNTTIHPHNNYTGLFRGKNLILLQMESMDTWLVSHETTPTLYKLSHDGINFTRHYSFIVPNGPTFNSEFCVNTGFHTPVSFFRSAYTYNTNHFPFGLARMFMKQGYVAQAFHMNTREYYDRGINYHSWGYRAYHGLADLPNRSNPQMDIGLDRQLILDKTFYDNLFHTSTPFLHYLITFSIHTPFSFVDSTYGPVLAKEQNLTEDCPEDYVARVYAGETDNMVRLLMQGLMDNGLYNNTVIIAYADHFLSHFLDSSLWLRYKTPEEEGALHTPLFIWAHDITSESIDKVNTQANILPTVLNLFGIDYVEEYYLGRDILDPSYRGDAFFPNGRWFEGTTFHDKPDRDSHLVFKKNDLTLKYDYFRVLESGRK